MIRGRKLFVGSFQLALLVVLLTAEFSGVDLVGLFAAGILSGVLYIFMEETLVKGGLAGRFLVSISSFKKSLNPVTGTEPIDLAESCDFIGTVSVLKFVKLSSESSFKLMSSSLASFSILAPMNNRNCGILLFLSYSAALLYYTIWTIIIVN